MYCNVIALFKNLIHGSGLHNVARKVPCSVHGKERVEAVYLHAERLCGVRNEHADRAKTNHAQLFAENFRTRKRGFSFFHLLRNVCRAF